MTTINRERTTDAPHRRTLDHGPAGVDILRLHLDMLNHALLVHSAGMTPGSIQQIDREISDLERLIKERDEK